MLPRPYRLPSLDIRRVLKVGKRKTTDYLQILYVPSQNKNSRYAVIVSKKVDKRAVVRNRNKRLVRESIRLVPPTNVYLDCVILVRRSLSDLHVQDVAARLIEALPNRQ